MNILQGCFTRRSLTGSKRALAVTALVVLAVVCFFVAMLIGATDVSLFDALRALREGETDNSSYKIILYIRLPRALGALFAGAALAVSGVIIQAVLNNPMAAPNIIGVNAGAGFFVILAMALSPSLFGSLQLAAFIGALAAALLIYAISSLTGAGRVTVTLVGVAVGSILTAGINTVKTLFPDSVYDVSGFLIGGFSSLSLSSVLPAVAMILPALVVSALLCRGLDALCLGTEVASGLGMNVPRARVCWLCLAAVLAGAAVSFSGLIGFVGLLIPHIMRRLVGSYHKYLVPASIFGGGAFLLIADVISRVLFAPYELPVGILLSLVGGPFFIFLIFATRRKI